MLRQINLNFKKRKETQNKKEKKNICINKNNKNQVNK